MIIEMVINQDNFFFLRFAIRKILVLVKLSRGVGLEIED